MNYLITGANGFLGNQLCQYLETKQINYLAAVRSNPKNKQVATGDLSTFNNWTEFFTNIDVVIHTAAKAHDMSNSEDLKTTYTRVNLELTKNLAMAAKKNHVKKFIFISTIKVNGEFTDNTPFTADDMPRPSDDYAASKHLAELELLKLHEADVFEVVIIRPCLIYAKGVKANFENLISLIKKQIPLPFGSINNKRSFISAANLADLIIACSVMPQASGQIFLASDDNDLSLTELIKVIAKELKIKPFLLPIPMRLMKLVFKIIGKSDFSTRLFSNLQVDITKTKILLNWKPPFSTSDEIRKMLT